MDLIHFVVKDGVLNNSSESSVQSTHREELESDRGTAYACMRHLQNLLEHSKTTMGKLCFKYSIFLSLKPFILDPSCQETLPAALEAVLERTQDFTDSAYTSHEHREAILECSERLKAELDHLLGLYANIVSVISNSLKSIFKLLIIFSFSSFNWGLRVLRIALRLKILYKTV